MANMSYCRFENTANDIDDCIDALDESGWDLEAMEQSASSKREAKAMRQFVRLCCIVADAFPDFDHDEDE